MEKTTVTVEPGKWVVLATTGYNGEEVIKTFAIGDEAVVGSYNLVYTGVIRKISPKTIEVVEYPGSSNEKVYRMKHETFGWRNWNFNAEEIARRNSETMMHI